MNISDEMCARQGEQQCKERCFFKMFSMGKVMGRRESEQRWTKQRKDKAIKLEEAYSGRHLSSHFTTIFCNRLQNLLVLRWPAVNETFYASKREAQF